MIATMFSTHFSRLLSSIVASLTLCFVLPSPGMSSESESERLLQCHNLQSPTILSTTRSACQHQDCIVTADSLTHPLIQALPGYTNRVLQRSPEIGLGEKSSYVIRAESLSQAPFSLNTDNTELIEQQNLSSIYFMTWERRYRNQTVFSVKRYHWLFLRHTPKGWEVVKLFSQSGPYPGYKLFPDPMDTTKGAMAEAIRLWLRDCQVRSQKSGVRSQESGVCRDVIYYVCTGVFLHLPCPPCLPIPYSLLTTPL